MAEHFLSKAEKLHFLCATMIGVALGMQNMMQNDIWVSKVELETATTCTIRLSIYYCKTYFTFIASQNQAVTNWLGYLVSVNYGIIAVQVTKSHAIHCVDPARLYSSDRVIKTEIMISVYVSFIMGKNLIVHCCTHTHGWYPRPILLNVLQYYW